MTARSDLSEVGIFVVYFESFSSHRLLISNWSKRQKIDNNEQFSLSLSHRVPPCPLKDRLGTPSKVLGSASLSPSSCLLLSSGDDNDRMTNRAPRFWCPCTRTLLGAPYLSDRSCLGTFSPKKGKITELLQFRSQLIIVLVKFSPICYLVANRCS